MPETPIELAVKALWDSTRARIVAGLDDSARAKYERLLRDGATDDQRTRINLVYVWEDQIWDLYNVAKAEIENGNLTSVLPSTAPLCPYTFDEIVPTRLLPLGTLNASQLAIKAASEAAAAAHGFAKPPKV